MTFRSDDPGRDFDRWDAYQNSLSEELPECDHCHKKIREDYYDIDGYLICPDCLERHFKRTIEL